MKSITNVLLASHGTDGALAAEREAMRLCPKGGKLHHLVVVPSLWKDMTGDDWLNNGSTRDRFRRYLESELGREVNDLCDRVDREAQAHGLEYTSEIVLGEPDECLVNTSRKNAFDLVIMGSPRPKGREGLRSRMHTRNLARQILVPLLIVPFPDE